MNTKNTSNLLFAALVGGGLYWASKQPGGVKGTWGRFNDKLREVQNSNDPLGTIKRQFSEARDGMLHKEPISMSNVDQTNSYEATAQA